MRLHLAAVISLIALSGCVAQRAAKFDESEYQPYLNPGTSTITGQAFSKTMGGDVKYGAGNRIQLVPMTTYSEEWYSRTYVGGQGLTDPDPREYKYIRYTTADGTGNFEFDSVPAGDYYVKTAITWMIDAYTTTGGWVCSAVHVEPGQTKKVVLTN